MSIAEFIWYTRKKSEKYLHPHITYDINVRFITEKIIMYKEVRNNCSSVTASILYSQQNFLLDNHKSFKLSGNIRNGPRARGRLREIWEYRILRKVPPPAGNRPRVSGDFERNGNGAETTQPAGQNDSLRMTLLQDLMKRPTPVEQAQAASCEPPAEEQVGCIVKCRQEADPLNRRGLTPGTWPIMIPIFYFIIYIAIFFI